MNVIKHFYVMLQLHLCFS